MMRGKKDQKKKLEREITPGSESRAKTTTKSRGKLGRRKNREKDDIMPRYGKKKRRQSRGRSCTGRGQGENPIGRRVREKTQDLSSTSP